MADPATWSELARWTSSLQRYVPDRVLRLGWIGPKLLNKIDAFHFDEAPRFHVREERLSEEASVIGFNLFNFTPFKLAIVGLELRVSLDSREIFEHHVRLPAEISMPPYARSGSWFKKELSESLIERLRNYPQPWA